MRRMPEGLEPIEQEMSNCDHSIDEGMDGALRAGGVGEHSAWDFHGDVWFEDGQFHEEVWVYKEYRETSSADTLEQLMTEVNAEYGSD